MKKPFRFARLLFLPILLFSACATRSVPKPEIPPRQEILPSPEVIAGLEAFCARIRQNHEDAIKRFTLDDEGNITVRTDIIDRTGSYEVIYDLTNAETLEPSVYRVNFSVTEKYSGARREDSLVWKPEAGLEGVLLALDDYYLDAWERHFELFEKYEAKITFFIQNAPRRGEHGLPDPAAFCAAALERGHDIGFHTINHLDLRKVSADTFLLETLLPLESFDDAEIPVSAFAYPYGFSAPWMHNVLLRRFGVVRGYGTTFRIYAENQIRAGHIISRAIDNTVIRGDENFRMRVLLMLRTVKFIGDGRVLPLTTHDISGEAAWGISAERLEFLLGAVSELHLKFYRYRDFLSRNDD